MKTKFTVIAILMSIASVYAQNEQLKKFEISTSVIFWSPTSIQLKSSNSITQYAYPDGTYLSTGELSGYGTSFAPELELKYFFNNHLGILLGFYMVHMDNELFVQKTDSTFSSYENLAIIPNFTLGLAGKFSDSQAFNLFYEIGINFIPGYDFEMQYADENSDPPDLNADGIALGVFAKTGANIRVIKSLYLNTAFMYSFIPTELEYANSEGSVKTNEKTNIGGIGLQIGLSVKF